MTGIVGGLTTATSKLVCNLGTVTNGNQQTVTVVTVPSTAISGTTITNPVTISTTTPEVNTSNNSDQISHKITRPTLDLITNKTDGPDPVELGGTTTYTVTVRNNGPSEAFNLVVTDTMPAAGMSFQSIGATSPGLTCTTAAAVGSFGGTVQCTQPNLPVGAVASFTVAMKAEARGPWVNRVEARSDEYADETSTDNNDVNETTTVFERSNLQVTKAASQALVDLNQPFDWTITVENVNAAGIGLAENVVLRDTLPAGMEVVGAVTTSGTSASCDAPVGGRDLICIIDDMAAGAQVTVTLPVRVTSVAANPQTTSNSATVTTESFDIDPADDTGTGTVGVKSTSVSGTIWRDFNEDGNRDANDSGIGGLNLTLTGTDDFGNSVSRTTTTGAGGSYDFGLLPPGNYSVSCTPPAGSTYQQGSALPGATGGGVVNTPIRIDNITADTDTPSGGNDFTLVPQPQVALAKQVSAPAFQNDGSYRLTYTFRIKNESQEPLSGFTLTDNLLTGFGSYVTGTPDHGEFSVFSVSSNATLHSGANTELVLGSPAQLDAGGTRSVTLVLQVNPVLPRTAATLPHTNNATVAGTGLWSGKNVTDGSNNGSTPQHGVTSNTSRNVTFTRAITLDKVAVLDNGGATAAPGDVIRYTFTVTNTGNTPLVGVTLADPLPDLIWDTAGPITQLDPGVSDSTTFTAHYTLTQADIEAGGVDNTATASGRWAVDGVTNPIVTDSDDASITALAEPSLTVVKAKVSDTVQTPTAVGDTIRYSFVVTNTGNVELRDVELTDALAGIAPDPAGSFVIGTLARAGEAGDSVTLYADYTVTQGDIDAGEVVNSATVSGTHGPDDTPVNADSNEVEVPLAQARDMRVTKLPDTPLPTAPRAGDTIGWTITIENTGNTRLEIGTIAEPLAGATVSAPAAAVLEPGESTTASASYTLTQADIDAGKVVNQVTVSGKVPVSDIPFVDTPSGNDPDTPNGDKTETPLPAVPGVALVKTLTTDVTGVLMPGDEIEFDFTITNTGNVTLSGLALTDHLAGVTIDDTSLTSLTLAPDASVTVTGSYTVTDADIEAGGLSNTAPVTGNDPHGTQVEDDSGTALDNDDPTEVPLIRDPAIALIKTISTAPTAPVAAGDVIEYAFEVRNTGNVELRDIDLTDLVGGVTVTGSRTAPLAVNGVDTTSFTGSYTLTQADIDASVFANSTEVTGAGTGPDGTDKDVSDTSGTAVDNNTPTEFVINPAPALTIVKAADDSAVQSPVQVGDVITYSFTVTNTGNVTLSDVTVTDPLLGGSFSIAIGHLLPGEDNAQTVTATYPIKQADIDAGKVVNTASVAGTHGPDDTPVSTDSNEVEVPLDQDSGLTVRSERALYGASGEYRSLDVTDRGEARLRFSGFAAQADSLMARDVLRATGGSAYFLSHQDIIAGSESLVVEVRSRTTGLVVESRRLTEGADYRINPVQGVVILNSPLSSATAGEGLISDNPLGDYDVNLVAQYEYVPATGKIDGYTAGARVEYWAGDHLRLGASGLRETTGIADQDLIGADVLLRFGEERSLLVEYAQSEGPGFGSNFSLDGGLDLEPSNPSYGLRGLRASSLRVAGETDLGFFGLDGEMSGVYDRKEAGFSSPDGDFQHDQRTWSVSGKVALSEATDLTFGAEVFRRADGKAEDHARLGFEHRISDNWTLEGEVARDRRDATASSLDHGRRTDAALRLTWERDEDLSYRVFAQGTLTRDATRNRNNRAGAGLHMGLGERADLTAEISDGNLGAAGRLEFGYRPDDDTQVTLGYRLDPMRRFEATDFSGRDRGSLVFGTTSRLNDRWSYTTETNYSAFGTRPSLTSGYGVTYTPGKRWRYDAAFQSGESREADGTALRKRGLSLGMRFNDGEERAGGLRGEWLRETSDRPGNALDRDTWLVSGFYETKVSPDWRFVSSLDAVVSESDQSSFRDGRYVEARLGYAWRPESNDHVSDTIEKAARREFAAGDKPDPGTRQVHCNTQRPYLDDGDMSRRPSGPSCYSLVRKAWWTDAGRPHCLPP